LFFQVINEVPVGEDEDKDKQIDLVFVKKPQPPRRPLQKE